MYLDPGFGSMIIQLVVAMIAGVGAVWLLFKNKIKGWFRKGKKDEADARSEATGEPAAEPDPAERARP